MTTNTKYSGLCSNCVLVERCSYRKNHNDPVLFCEEFVCEEKSAFGIVETKVENLLTLAADRGEVNGLCINCSNNTLCHFEKIKAGVFHCNEYEIENELGVENE